jgi:hypothetical protein
MTVFRRFRVSDVSPPRDGRSRSRDGRSGAWTSRRKKAREALRTRRTRARVLRLTSYPWFVNHSPGVGVKSLSGMRLPASCERGRREGVSGSSGRGDDAQRGTRDARGRWCPGKKRTQIRRATFAALFVVEGDGRRERVHGERVEARGAARNATAFLSAVPKSESGPEKVSPPLPRR